MVIYLRHPIHGSKVATMEAEAKYDEQNGWVRYAAGTLLTPIEPSLNQLDKPRGRPRKEARV